MCGDDWCDGEHLNNSALEEAEPKRDSPEDWWLEFESGPLTHGAGFEYTVCGLCGNSGRINILKIKAPCGQEVKGAQGYCICPNGRILKKGNL